MFLNWQLFFLNTKYVVFLDATPDCSELNFNIGNSDMATPRSWEIKITQYNCGDEKGGNLTSMGYCITCAKKYDNSLSLSLSLSLSAFLFVLSGPPDCLQYFSGTSGTISSFNFRTDQPTVSATATHLSSQCYSACFR